MNTLEKISALIVFVLVVVSIWVAINILKEDKLPRINHDKYAPRYEIPLEELERGKG